MLRDQANQTQQRNTMLVFSLVGAFIALLLANYLLFYRGTLRSIEFLQTGTKIIGSGNLDFSLEEKRNDEIGELSRSFNLMTANLKTVTASKSDLEREIVERMQAEVALRESEEKYRTIVETANEGIWTVDARLITTFVNEKMAWMLGYGPNEMIGISAFNFMDEESKALANKRLERRVQGIRGSYEHKYLRKDGSPIWTIANVTPLQDSEGKFTGSIGLLTDITEHKHLDQMLRQTNERLDMAQRASGAGTWDWNILTSHLIWSPELFDLFGLDPQKSVASFEAWDSALHPEDRKIANSRINQALKEHTNLDSEYRIMRPDGQMRWINALGRGTYDDQSRPVRMIGICIDITERKRVEERMAYLLESCSGRGVRVERGGSPGKERCRSYRLEVRSRNAIPTDQRPGRNRIVDNRDRAYDQVGKEPHF
jgi:PAS domain S-box-containing protein